MRNRVDWPLLIAWIVLLAFCVSVLWATVHYAVPPVREHIEEFIEWLFPNPLSWTMGIIQESPAPRRVVYAGHTMYVWE